MNSKVQPNAASAYSQRRPSGEWSVDEDGRRADPITLRVKGRLEDIERALKKTGWTQADTNTFGDGVTYLGNAVREEVQRGVAALEQLVSPLLPSGLLPKFCPEVPGVQRMPVSPAFLHGRGMVVAFERNNEPIGGRDHLLIYRTGPDEFAIAPSKDSGMMFEPDRPQTAFINHRPVPDVVPERDAVIQSLETGGDAQVVGEQSQAFGGGSVYGERVSDSETFDLTLPKK